MIQLTKWVSSTEGLLQTQWLHMCVHNKVSIEFCFISKLHTIKYVIILKTEFEMNDLGKIKFCLSLQYENIPSGIFIHQSTNIQMILDNHIHQNTYNNSIPKYESRSIHILSWWWKNIEHKILYFSAIKALMYLTNRNMLDIAFADNLLA